MSIDATLLRRALSYNPETGSLTWNAKNGDDREVKRWNARYAGKPALNCPTQNGHLAGNILGKSCKAHRAAWAIYYGEWPSGEIDHANGKPNDNRIENLREATRTQNAQNTKKRVGGTSRYRGVSRDGIKWRAMVNAFGKRTHIGAFKDELSAAIAYDLFAVMLHGQFARPNIIHDREAITAFVEEYARRNHSLGCKMEGLRVWQEKVAK